MLWVDNFSWNSAIGTYGIEECNESGEQLLLDFVCAACL